ncbi:hypothetical protein [Luteolibacter soli]|uniref:Uncharacterized protein n=1 Tax=Luteolibacter soli TaxID=3135280 RepID=A0ABU9ARG4_9BACT
MNVGLVFVLLGLSFLVIATLIPAALSAAPYPQGVVVSMGAVVAEMIVVGMLSGAIWLAMHLESRPTGLSPRHPGRGIVLPMVGTPIVGGIIAVPFWVPSIFIHDVSRTFPWPLVWGAAGIGAFSLYRYLDRILPK